jgi:hypothetical protein
LTKTSWRTPLKVAPHAKQALPTVGGIRVVSNDTPVTA